MIEEQLPAGYVELNRMAIHVSKLRKHTTDIRRFLDYSPLCEAIGSHAPGSPEWQDLVATLTVGERKDVGTTIREMGVLMCAVASDLENEEAM